MTAILWLVAILGLAPMALGMVLLKPAMRPGPAAFDLGAALLCALAFNLTFFWQELWLVIPKALTPGLHPVLFHNNHDWTGDAPNVDLLQGTGAIATLVSGLVACGVLAFARRLSPSWRAFAFWMAFQGLFQSMSQLAIGTLLPGNDVGRALGYLRIQPPTTWGLLALSVLGMAAAGAWLARVGEASRERRFGWGVLAVIVASLVLIVPFRLPRNLIEVLLIPTVVEVMGAGWLILGAAMVGRAGGPANAARPAVVAPAIALGLLLLVFQLVLRPGVAF